MEKCRSIWERFERIAPGTKAIRQRSQIAAFGLAGRKAEMKKGGIKRFESTVSGGGSSTRRRRRAAAVRRKKNY